MKRADRAAAAVQEARQEARDLGLVADTEKEKEGDDG